MPTFALEVSCPFMLNATEAKYPVLAVYHMLNCSWIFGNPDVERGKIAEVGCLLLRVAPGLAC